MAPAMSRAAMEMATDYLLGAATLYWAIRLLLRRRMPLVQLYWGIGFLALSAAAFVGGTYHGFTALDSPSVRGHLWNATLLLIGASAGFLTAGAFSGPLRPWEANARWIYAGLILTIAAVGLRHAHVALGPRLGDNALFHLFEIAAFACFYRGASLTTPARASKTGTD